MINIAICDDDFNFIQYMKGTIIEAGISEESVVFYEYLSGEALSTDFDKNIAYDLLLLSDRIQGMDANSVAVKFREYYPNAVLVFCSQNYMPTPFIFKVTPFRYLLKQYEKALMITELKEVIDVLNHRKREPIIVGKYYNNIVKLFPQEIMYFSIAKSGSNIYLCPNASKFEFENHLICKKKLSEIYQTLNEYDFVYIHNSYIVNLNYIKRKTERIVEMINGDILTISRSREKEFREKFTVFLESKYN